MTAEKLDRWRQRGNAAILTKIKVKPSPLESSQSNVLVVDLLDRIPAGSLGKALGFLPQVMAK